MKCIRKRASSSNVFRVKILDNTVGTGVGKTGLSSSTGGLIIAATCDNEQPPSAGSGAGFGVTYTVAASHVQTIATLGTYAAPSASCCRFKEVDSTNHPGLYELQIDDTRFSVAGSRTLIVSISGATGAGPVDIEIQLTSTDVDDATAGGISRLDAAVSGVPAAVWAVHTGTFVDTSSVGFLVVGDLNAAVGDVNSAAVTLLNRLTSARAGYLDNLNVSGIVATQTDVLNLHNNTSLSIDVPQVLERPDSGSFAFPFTIITRNDSNALADADSTPSISVKDHLGNDMSSHLSSITHASTGIYTFTYTLNATDSIDILKWVVTCNISSRAQRSDRYSQIVDTTAVDFTSSDRTKLTQLAGDYTTARAAKLDNLDEAISSIASGSDSPGVTTLLSRVGTPSGASVSADVLSVLSRLGGWTGSGLNTVLGAFRALAAKANGLTPSDMTSGTTFDNTTDSMQALRDNGDTNWGFEILPVVSTVQSGEVVGKRIIAYQNARLGPYTFTIVDQTGAAVNLFGHSISFAVGTTAGTDLWQLDDCSIGGTSSNVVTVSQDDTNTGTAGVYRYALRDTTSDALIARGELVIESAPNVS